MKQNILTICLALLLLSSCTTKKDKVEGNFVDVFEGENRNVIADKSSVHYQIKLPQSARNSSWNSSGFSLRNVPQNIKVSMSSNKPSTYKVFGNYDSDIKSLATVVVVNDVLYTIDNESTVYAYNVSNPDKLLWKTHLATSKDSFIGGGLYCASGLLAATFGDKDLVLLNAKSGRVKWRYALSNISRSAPVIIGDVVLVSTIDNRLYAFNINNGYLKWVHSNPDTSSLTGANLSAAEVKDNVVVVPYSSAQMVALDLGDGKPLWGVDFSILTKNGGINSEITPMIKNNVVYVTSPDGNLYALDLLTGKLAWHSTNAGGKYLWVSGNMVYTVNNDAQMIASSASGGSIKWVHNFEDNSAVYSSPVMINDSLYVASSNGKLTIVDARNGKTLSSIETHEELYSPPVVVGNDLYLLGQHGKLIVIH